MRSAQLDDDRRRRLACFKAPFGLATKLRPGVGARFVTIDRGQLDGTKMRLERLALAIGQVAARCPRCGKTVGELMSRAQLQERLIPMCAAEPDDETMREVMRCTFLVAWPPAQRARRIVWHNLKSRPMSQGLRCPLVPVDLP